MSAPDTERKWYVQTSTNIVGPYSLEQLKQLAQRQILNQSTKIKDNQTGVWFRADQVPYLFSDSSAAPAAVAPRQSPAPRPAGPFPVGATPPVIPRPGQPPPSTRSSTIPSRFPRRRQQFDSKTMIVTAAISSVAVVGMLALLGLAIRSSSKTTKSPPAQHEMSAETDNPSSPTESSEARATSDALATDELVEKTSAGVALVETKSGSGSGFVIPGNILVTNYHVIADADSDEVVVYFPDGTSENKGPFPAALIDEHPHWDLALLALNRPLPTVEVDWNHKFRKGLDVVVIGSPGLFRGREVLPNAVTLGVLSSEHVDDGQTLYQLAIAINPGNSGGPVFKRDGRVIGVVVSKSLSEEAIGFCVPAPVLSEFVESVRSNTGMIATAGAASRHDARKLVRRVTSQVLLIEEKIGELSEHLASQGINASQTSSSDFMRVISAIFDRYLPELNNDFTIEFDGITNDPDLTVRQRSDLQRLQQRHRAINNFLSDPPGNINSLQSGLGHLVENFMRQREAVDNSLGLLQ